MTHETWSVTLEFDGDGQPDGATLARAVLHGPEGEQLHGEGRAVRWTGHPDRPEIGRQVAASRALTALGQRLGDAAVEAVLAHAYSTPALET